MMSPSRGSLSFVTHSDLLAAVPEDVIARDLQAAVPREAIAEWLSAAPRPRPVL
jgi:hypothetical protein